MAYSNQLFGSYICIDICNLSILDYEVLKQLKTFLSAFINNDYAHFFF